MAIKYAASNNRFLILVLRRLHEAITDLMKHCLQQLAPKKSSRVALQTFLLTEFLFKRVNDELHALQILEMPLNSQSNWKLSTTVPRQHKKTFAIWGRMLV